MNIIILLFIANANNSPEGKREMERPLHFFFLHVFIMIGQFLPRVVVRVPLMFRPEEEKARQPWTTGDHGQKFTSFRRASLNYSSASLTIPGSSSHPLLKTVIVPCNVLVRAGGMVEEKEQEEQ